MRRARPLTFIAPLAAAVTALALVQPAPAAPGADRGDGRGPVASGSIGTGKKAVGKRSRPAKRAQRSANRRSPAADRGRSRAADRGRNRAADRGKPGRRSAARPGNRPDRRAQPGRRRAPAARGRADNPSRRRIIVRRRGSDRGTSARDAGRDRDRRTIRRRSLFDRNFGRNRDADGDRTLRRRGAIDRSRSLERLRERLERHRRLRPTWRGDRRSRPGSGDGGSNRDGPLIRITPRNLGGPGGVTIDPSFGRRDGAGDGSKKDGDGKDAHDDHRKRRHGGKGHHGRRHGHHKHHRHRLRHLHHPLHSLWCYWYGSPTYRTYEYNYYVESPTYVTGAAWPADPVSCLLGPHEAWDLLARGYAGAAHEAFACLADTRPDEGGPLVGLALAAALTGHHDEAVAAMRDAMLVEPEALLDVRDEGMVDLQLSVIADELRRRDLSGDADALFMAAAVHLLRGENATARYAVTAATALGDDSDSTYTLEALIELESAR